MPRKRVIRSAVPAPRQRRSWSRYAAVSAAIAVAVWLGGSRFAGLAGPAGPRQYSYEVVRVYPHDRSAYTQGLVYIDGYLYEGTGMNGQSSLRKVNIETGEVLQRHDLGSEYFGEGIALLEGKLFQLTWKNEVGFVYDRSTFALERMFRYPGEGWGLTHDGKRLIMSDGSATIRFIDPHKLEEIARIDVRDGDTPVRNLNELEWVRGEVWANVWTTNRIVCFSPKTGQVTAWIHLNGLLSDGDRMQQVDVLNGIAYDPKNDRIFVTGKWWPKLFEIRVAPMK